MNNMTVGSIRTTVNPPLTSGIYEALLEKAERERDEAREAATKWESSSDAMERAGAEQARRADENREWAVRAELERDEARAVLKVIEQAHHAALYREGELKRERDEARELARWFYTRLKQVSLDHPLEGNVGGILARLEEAVLDDPWLEAAK